MLDDPLSVNPFDPKTTLPPVVPPPVKDEIVALDVTPEISKNVDATLAKVTPEEAIDPEPLNANVPWLTVVIPLYVLAAVNVNVPAPCFVVVPVPEIIFENDIALLR